MKVPMKLVVCGWLFALADLGGAHAQNTSPSHVADPGVVYAAAPIDLHAHTRVRWFPIGAKYSPDGKWAVVNLCSVATPTYCRLVKWEPDEVGSLMPNGIQSTGRWTLIPGQDAATSYIWPDISRDGQRLAFVVANCQGQLNADSKNSSLPVPQSCDLNDGQLAHSPSVRSLDGSIVLQHLRTVTKPAWRPDGQALLYWRSLNPVRLASGMTMSHRDLFEYDMEAKQETAKHERSATRILWSREATGPFYDEKGESFIVCGSAFSVPVAMDAHALFNCMETNANKPTSTANISTRYADPFFEIILGRIGDDTLIVAGSHLELRSKRSARDRTLLIPLTPSGIRSNHGASFAQSAAKNSILVISGTLFGYVTPRKIDKYFRQVFRDRSAAPVMFIAPIGTTGNEALKVIFWPDIEFLN